MQRAAILFFVMLAGCEAKGACDTPQANRCVDGVAKSACVLHGPNHEVSRFSRDKTCAQLGYKDGAGAPQHNDALGFAIAVPAGATVVTSSDTAMIRWVVDGDFPALCAITTGPKDTHPRSLDDAKAAFERSGAFKAVEATEDASGYALTGLKVTDPKITQYAVRRAGATKAGEALCTAPVGHAPELKSIVTSLKVD